MDLAWLSVFGEQASGWIQLIHGYHLERAELWCRSGMHEERCQPVLSVGFTT